MNKIIYFHLDNQDYLPVGVDFDKINNIENYQDDSLEQVMVQDLLDYYSIEDNYSLLIAIKQKIISGGLISIQSIDIKQLGIAIAFEEIPTDIVKDLLYPNKKSIKSMYDIEAILKELGFDIQIKKYINIFEYYILAKKI